MLQGSLLPFYTTALALRRTSFLVELHSIAVRKPAENLWPRSPRLESPANSYSSFNALGLNEIADESIAGHYFSLKAIKSHSSYSKNL